MTRHVQLTLDGLGACLWPPEVELVYDAHSREWRDKRNEVRGSALPVRAAEVLLGFEPDYDNLYKVMVGAAQLACCKPLPAGERPPQRYAAF